MDIVRRRYPDKKFAELGEEAETQYIGERYDTSKAHKELGMKFRSLEDAVGDTADYIFSLPE
jgi:nucleoside-diphosphate-sugar epimerase